MIADITRVPFSAGRWAWYVNHGDGTGVGGWTFTHWGARRAVERERRARGGR